MPYSPYMLYQTMNQQPGLPTEPILVVGPIVTTAGELAFSDTSLKRHLPAGKLVETSEGFTWTPASGGPAWTFVVVTRELFDRDWRSRIVATGWIPTFDTNEELWEFYSVHFGHGFWQ